MQSKNRHSRFEFEFERKQTIVKKFLCGQTPWLAQDFGRDILAEKNMALKLGHSQAV